MSDICFSHVLSLTKSTLDNKLKHVFDVTYALEKLFNLY